MPSHKSNDYKLTAVQYYLVEDKTQEEVCKIFKCTPRSLMRWVERYKKDGNVNIHYRKPVAYKVKKEYVKLLVTNIPRKTANAIYDFTLIFTASSAKYYVSSISSVQIGSTTTSSPTLSFVNGSANVSVSSANYIMQSINVIVAANGTAPTAIFTNVIQLY